MSLLLLCCVGGVTLLVLFLLCDCDPVLRLLCWVGRKPSALAGHVIWVTGASSGIGEALAVNLASAGVKLALSARRRSELERARERCLAAGAAEDDVLVLPLDVTDLTAHSSALETLLAHFHKLDVLVNNAGRSQRSSWSDTDPEVDRQLWELNVLAPVQLTRVALPALLSTGHGHVVVMSSTAGTCPVPCSGSYTGSKHALHGYFGALRSELASSGLAVTMLCPGPTFSDLLSSAFVARPGEVYGGKMASSDRRMTAERCAYLSSVAMANRLAEAWIAIQPVLLFQYAVHWAPWIVNAVFRLSGSSIAMQLRDSKPAFDKKSE